MTEQKLSDEDTQAFTMQKITDILIAGGYFRARISGLSRFDRVVGGMSWAITASGVPINVEVEFKENAKIGEQILISEKIVRALLEMDCPFVLEPHHIQGLKLNCVPLFPVVQWLVKSVIDYRRITGDRVRNFSNFLFDVSFDRVRYSKHRNKVILPEHDDGANAADDDDEEQKNASAMDAVDVITNEAGRVFYDNILSNYSMKRRFCKQKNTRFSTPASFVDATLLEYGFLFRAQRAFGGGGDDDDDFDASSPTSAANANASSSSGGGGGGGSSSKSKLQSKFGALMKQMGHSESSAMNVLSSPKQSGGGSGSNLEQISEEEQAQAELRRLQDIKTQMQETEMETSNIKMSGGAIAAIIDSELVQTAKSEVNNALENDGEMDGNSGAFALNSAKSKEMIYTQRKEKLKARYKELSESKKLKISEYKALTEKVSALEAQNAKLNKKQGKIAVAMKDLDEIQNQSANRHLLAKLKALVMKNEEIKNQMSKFKQSCVEQQSKFETELLALDSIETNPSEIERIKKINLLYKKDMKKFDKIRNLLASKNQEVAKIQRKLESYPTRSELLQYEKRFIELYNLTNERLKETKKYYHLYNSLNDSYASMKHEVQLLKKIETEFPKRYKNVQDRTAFIESMKKMIVSLENNNFQATERANVIKKEKDLKTTQYTKLLNYQRKYYTLVKEFQNACNINSQINDRMEIIQAQVDQYQK